ncbi:hypothetical protein OESDEN_07279 [Oesophagostomum dentatum]|uniref:SRCR domain-containing protein n=1 Tax=Oesophagostomum dentatum TaxID=61180 RepID=A0A0B1T5H4_OESDE|nr:hypothetical protein OESDEN_07279 [Oesophagostomum dentatum]
MTCPSGFKCTAVLTNTDGQCPQASCGAGIMKAGPSRTTVTSLTCNGNQQWVDAQGTVYSVAQCETSCTACTALSNTGMTCPKGFECEAALRREGQCSETYCPQGTMTGNPARTTVTLLTCDATAQWKDAANAAYTTAQCEIPCNTCPALTNTGMACLSGFTCTPVLTNTNGQCPQAYCGAGVMTAGPGRTTVTSLTCNGNQQWVDPQGTAYNVAQCETSCTCPELTITPSPSGPPPTRGNALGKFREFAIASSHPKFSFRLVTDMGVVTLEPPGARNTPMTCVDGKWKATINGVQTTVTEQACYIFPCTTCSNVRTGNGVMLTFTADPVTWCKGYTLSGCPNGYRVGGTTIGSTLTCSQTLRWTSGPFNSPVGGSITVNCV